MRPSVLYQIFLVALSIFLAIMSPPSASPSSSLPQRRERHIRQARVYANIAPYRSPRREPGIAPLRNIRNAPAVQHGPELEQHHSAQRDADWERQLALQETPSRRRRRLPERRDENRAPSPTLIARRPLPQPVFAGAGTPPATQQAPLPPNRHTLAQQARRERERQAAAAAVQAAPQAPQAPPPTRREAAQRARREREQHAREERAQQQLLTPPATCPQQPLILEVP
ncbi:hypothetical protein B0H13DRAFT_1883200 [Mycena leptocephala]|nr:hypothetical protein B0H13DRAFT_1883200 [Mycena leptocephala]